MPTHTNLLPPDPDETPDDRTPLGSEPVDKWIAEAFNPGDDAREPGEVLADIFRYHLAVFVNASRARGLGYPWARTAACAIVDTLPPVPLIGDDDDLPALTDEEKAALSDGRGDEPLPA